VENIICSLDDKGSYSHLYYENPKKISHYHHSKHNEILIFVDGNSKMAVEGSEYYLNPYDIMIIRSSEMHRMYHIEPTKPYERYVWHIPDNFFIKNNCEELSKVFMARSSGEGNRIPGELVKDSYVSDILKKTDEYASMPDNVPQSVMRGKLIELLFHLNILHSKVITETTTDTTVRNVIKYINDNISEKLSLDAISDNFFMSKSYLCHKFKNHTGLTVNQYIKHKRFIKVRELSAEGMNLSDASIKAGFGSYSNFYKTYLAETGHAPSEELK